MNASWLEYGADPVKFAAQQLHFTPDTHQSLVLAAPTPRGILCCTRQWGKSTVAAIKAVHHAYFHPNSLVLVAAPTERQSSELVRKCAAFLAAIGIRRRGDGQNACSLVLPNHSRIVGLPGNDSNIRGFSAPSLILIDEAARVPDPLYHALLPMLATSTAGQLWMMSTPNGRQGFFYEEWFNPENGFTRVSVTARECRRIPAAFLDAEERRMPRHVFEQEYLCVFAARTRSLLSDEDLQSTLDPTLTALFPGS